MKLNKKKIMLSLLCGTLVLGSAVGVSAAYNNYRSSGVWQVESGGKTVTLDGDAIGYWFIPETKEFSKSAVTGNGNKITLTDNGMSENSMVDIYYSNSVLNDIANAEPSYEQTGHSVVITFKRPEKLPAKVSIDCIHVTNPVNTDNQN